MWDKRFPEDSIFPNWPKPETLVKERFSIYCTPVQQAIEAWLKILRKDDLLKKYLSSERDNITNQEFEEIREAYASQIDIICWKNWIDL